MMPDYDGLRFGPEPLVPGAVTGHYRQVRDLVTAEFGGGLVRTGRLVGTVDERGVIDAGYCQIMRDGEVVAGRCLSTPSLLADGRIVLTERWQRCDGSSGVSRIVQLAGMPLTDVPLTDVPLTDLTAGAETGTTLGAPK